VEVVRKGIGKFWTCRNTPEITQCFKLKNKGRRSWKRGTREIDHFHFGQSIFGT